MKRKLTRGVAALALGLLGGVLAGGGRPAAAATLIQNCGFTATLPGTYVLARDLTCRGTAITVAVDNVNLVLAGHTLTGPGGFVGVGALNVTGLKITGGTIVGFSNGIRLDNTLNARVAGVTVTGNAFGIFSLQHTTGAQISGNTATNNAQIGIELSGTTDALLAGNTATNNGVIGILLTSDSDSNRVVGNTATGNSSDLVDNNPPPCVNTWQGNTFATRGGAGAACIR